MEALDGLITRLRDPEAEILRFPPVMSRRQLENPAISDSFPNLLGCVCCLHGTEADDPRGGRPLRERRRLDHLADVGRSGAHAGRLLSALSDRRGAGRVAGRGLQFDVAADCFRHEPSNDLDRLQSFRMREFVRIGSPEQIVDFRDGWMARAQRSPTARTAATRSRRQRSVLRPRRPDDGGQPVQQALKFELLIPSFDRAADRLHELQLSPRPFRPSLEHARRRVQLPIPAASPSASTAWPWRCSASHGLDSRNTGRRAFARRSGSDAGP